MQNKIAAARFRAKALSDLRTFFSERKVLEVETPLLSQGVSHDFHIDPFSVPTDAMGSIRFLQTSPEPHMKRLLARGYPDIFQISKAFRMGDRGNRHNPEFTLIEWYRLNFDLHQMMEETVALCQCILGKRPTNFVTYADAFKKGTGLDPLSTGFDVLVAHPAVGTSGLSPNDFNEKSDILNFLMSCIVEPTLDPSFLTVIHGFPIILSSQAMADSQIPDTSLRFEVFCGGMELGNGYQELRKASEYRTRFEAENTKRQANGKLSPHLDENWFADIGEELPACSGVALGMDRLIQLGMNLTTLDDVLEFSWEKS